MQGLCKELGNKFNQQGAPKRVEFLMAWVLQLTRNNESIIYGLEPFIGTPFSPSFTLPSSLTVRF